DLVKIEQVIEPLSPAIGVLTYVGDDGSRFPSSYLADRARGDAQCQQGSVSDGTMRCVPASGATAVGYTDPGCTQPAVVAATCAKPDDPNAPYVKTITPVACVAKATVHQV